MERYLSLTYRMRTFLIRPVVDVEGAWTEAVFEETPGRDGPWKGSGFEYTDPVDCLVQAVRDVITVLDEEAADP
jgi:hypothetical protein